MLKLFALTALAMIAFAANSVFTRIALVETTIDPIVFTTIRICSGAILLYALVFFTNKAKRPQLIKGNGWNAIALFSYAIFFSFSYLTLGAGLGALILFASVQFTMIAWALVKGERFGVQKILGIAIALAAFIYLVAPGAIAPDLVGTILMIIAGMSWGVYSLLGRGSKDPIADTMTNFVRAAPLSIGVMLGIWLVSDFWPIDPTGIIYAILSGTLASGVGYAIWYAALPALSRTSAGVVQLTVPAIATLGGILFIGEALTLEFTIASLVLLAGVGLATTARA